MMPRVTTPNSNCASNVTEIAIESRHECGDEHSTFRFGKLLQTMYLIATLLLIIGFLCVAVLQRLRTTFMIINISSVFIVVLCSCYGLIKFAKVRSYIQTLKTETDIYQKQSTRLQNSRKQLQNDISEHEQTIEKLDSHLSELKEDAKEFSELITKLNDISHLNEDIMDTVDNMNASFERMIDLIRKNQRTYLLQNFYEVLKHSRVSLDQDKYERFLYRITPKWRQKFLDRGTFDKISQLGVNIKWCIWYA